MLFTSVVANATCTHLRMKDILRLCANFLWCVPSWWVENVWFLLAITVSQWRYVLFDPYLFTFICLPYHGNDMIIWIFPIVPCHAFCMWHWPIGKVFDSSFIWGHHHLSEYMDISRPTEYFIACYTVLTRPNKVETAVHSCSCWLSVWILSCRCPVKLFT